MAPLGAVLTPSVGGQAARSSSPQFQVEWSVGPAGAPLAASSEFSLWPLAAGPQLPLGPAAPQVLAVHPSSGPAAGGQPVRLLGIGWGDPGAIAQFTQAPAFASAAPLQTVSHLEAQGVAPPGVNTFGNPLGAVAVSAADSLGTGVASEYRYLPSLVRRSPAQLGEPLVLELEAAPGALFAVFLGAPIPGVALPIPPYGGALELLTGLVNLVGFLPAPAGTLLLPLPVPEAPALAGLLLHLQAFALEPFLGGFTNRISFTLLP